DISSLPRLARTFTPALLHFGELHLIFNMLWLWFFGRQLEAQQPRWLFGLLILLTAFAGNTAQYLYAGANNFGGMSVWCLAWPDTRGWFAWPCRKAGL
ncbi:MAG: rhomboid family intramembrane serine protease, partial [Gammaproteobacteria bacterium]